MTEIDLPADTPTPPAGLRALLSELIDYAGSFPPASLPLVKALQNYAAYARSSWSWMLARFVCPASGLAELSGSVRPFAPPQPLRLSLLWSGGETEERLLAALDPDCRATARFVRRHGTRIVVDQAEVRLPPACFSADEPALRRLFGGVEHAYATAELGPVDTFFELPLDDDFERIFSPLANAIRAHNSDRGMHSGGRFGVKMRLGGARTSDIPPADLVARFIVRCRDTEVPFKATAGLHHPFRHVDESTGAPAHGFINVFAGAVMADAYGLDARQVAALLSDGDAQHFSFDDQHVGWTHVSADLARAERVRRTLALSFGSCSFAEPADHLRSLGLL